MIKPAFVTPGEAVTTMGHVFGTRLVVKGASWLPVAQIVATLGLAWVFGRRHHGRSRLQQLGLGAATMPVVLGSEWCHNLAHAAAAHAIGKPMDALRVVWGMPMIVYFDLEDRTVAPREHVFRALGGPAFSLLAAALAALLRLGTRPRTLARDMADAAVATNVFIGGFGLLPIPGIDGGPIVKWSLVAHGRTPAQADLALRKIDAVLGAVLGAGAVLAFRRRQPLPGALLALFAGTALAIATGWVREQAPRQSLETGKA